ncbi:hypothetical protein LCGC14_2410310 [marine sediment metagenome]|uniref:Peptidase M15A C-terminal domain-containing protein n=1 Tax=marine sediment metagenome TaxID=412755 RepID=A0A0F9BSK0_9ZZZZ
MWKVITFLCVRFRFKTFSFTNFLFVITLDPQAYSETIGDIMYVKFGVDISRLNREIRRSLPPVRRICNKHGVLSVISSTYEGNHGVGSLHYSNDAYDITSTKIRYSDVFAEIKVKLGKKYDVVFEIDHIHIEYDPK